MTSQDLIFEFVLVGEKNDQDKIRPRVRGVTRDTVRRGFTLILGPHAEETLLLVRRGTGRSHTVQSQETDRYPRAVGVHVTHTVLKTFPHEPGSVSCDGRSRHPVKLFRVTLNEILLVSRERLRRPENLLPSSDCYIRRTFDCSFFILRHLFTSLMAMPQEGESVETEEEG